MNSQVIDQNTIVIRQKSRKSRILKENIIAYSMFLPSLAFLFVFLIIPILIAVYISMFDYSGVGKLTDFIGVSNFVDTLKDRLFFKSIWTTAKLAFFNSIFSVTIGFLLGYCLYRRVGGWRFFSVALYIPALIMESVSAILWRQLYEPNNGLINSVLRSIGLGKFALSWLSDPNWALAAGIIATIWAQVPFIMLVLYSALLNVSNDIIEAARIDGASETRQMLSIVLPNVIPMVMFLLILVISNSFRSFGMLYIMTGGGPANETMTATIYIFKQGSTWSNYGYATALAFETAVYVAALIGGLKWVLKKADVLE